MSQTPWGRGESPGRRRVPVVGAWANITGAWRSRKGRSRGGAGAAGWTARPGGVDAAVPAGLRGAWLSIGAYVLLSALKVAVGWRSASRGMLADGVNNLADVVGSVAVWWALRVSAVPADAEHRYGHGRAETVAQMVVGTLMGVVGLDLGLGALAAVLGPEATPPAPFAAWVGVASAAAMGGVYLYNRHLARRTGSPALWAAARDNRADALVSLGTAGGIWGAQRGWNWADPLAGFVVAALVVRTAWRLVREAAHELLDGFDARRLRDLRRHVERVQGVRSVRDIRARRLGAVTAVDVTVTVDPRLTVAASHAVADGIERALRREPDVTIVHVHVEPHDPAAEPGDAGRPPP